MTLAKRENNLVLKVYLVVSLNLSPYKECCGDQQYGQVHCNSGLKVKVLEESGSVCHQQQEEGGKIGG